METRHEHHHHRSGPNPPVRLASINYRNADWNAAQMVAHHTVNGRNPQAGNLLGTGTLSGPTLDAACSLIELTAGGKSLAHLPNGEVRAWAKDSDAITLSGWRKKPGVARIGFGECTARVLRAPQAETQPERTLISHSRQRRREPPL